jgi:hypothetical protein
MLESCKNTGLKPTFETGSRPRRDDFRQPIKDKLAARVGYRCSNPDCRASTSGPQISDDKAVSVGVAAHISAASSGGPRFNPSLTSQQRSGIKNGIWLCQTCSKLIDGDEKRYTTDLLVRWRVTAEREAQEHIGKAKPKRTSLVSAERRIKRDLRLRDQMCDDFLKAAKDRKAETAIQNWTKVLALVHGSRWNYSISITTELSSFSGLRPV